MEKIKIKMDETGKIRVEFKYSKEALDIYWSEYNLFDKLK